MAQPPIQLSNNSARAIRSASLQCVNRPLASLKLDARNPRAHSPKQIKQIARSIEAFGFNVPVLINAEGQVIAGHGRVLACRQLGWTDVPTIQLDHMSAAQARAFTVADNRLAETSSWDQRLLAETLRELSLAEIDFDLGAIGFDMPEIDLRIESLQTEAGQGADPADTFAPPVAGPAINRPGTCGSSAATAYCAATRSTRRPTPS